MLGRGFTVTVSMVIHFYNSKYTDVNNRRSSCIAATSFPGRGNCIAGSPVGEKTAALMDKSLCNTCDPDN